MSKSILNWLIPLVIAAGGFAVAEVEPTRPPSVQRRVLVCDRWQWIGGTAITYGCLSTPREAYVAGGQATDEAIISLQKQIHALETRLKKLERP